MPLQRGAAAIFIAAVFLSSCGNPAAATVPAQTASATAAPPAPTTTPSPLPATSTATLAPPPRTFTEGFDIGSPYWQVRQAGATGSAVALQLDSGALRIELPDPHLWAYAVYADQEYDDVRIDAVVDFGPGDGSSAGVICRYDSVLGWYEFTIHPDRTYTILFGRWLAEGIARYIPLVVSQSEQILATVNEIGLVCQGDILTPYVNSVQLRRRQETQHVLTVGQVGVSAASSDAGGQTVSFDWISVGSPDP